MARREQLDLSMLILDKSFTVATVPAAKDNPKAIIYVSNGSAGSACLAFSNGTDWKVLATLGNTISAT